MKYKRGDRVDFTSNVDGKIKSGNIRDAIHYSQDISAYWVSVKEGFSYLNTLEINGRIIKWLNQFSPTIEYWVLEHEIKGLTPEKEDTHKTGGVSC